MVTLADLLPPLTAEGAKALLLETLQGIGPVQQIGAGAGTVVPSGNPLNSYDFLLEVTTSGTLGAGAFRYSLDGGTSFSGAITIPGGGVYSPSGTGLSLTFAGDFVQGDQYLFQTIYPPFPVTDWESGGAARTLVEADAATLADLVGVALPEIAAGGLVGYASGDWLTLLSSQNYLNERFVAAPTVGLVQLVLAASAPALSAAAGELVVSNSVGSGAGVLLFSNVGAVSLAPGATASFSFQAERPGAEYNVQNGVLTVLKTPKPGLTSSNPAPGTSAVTHSGGGAGTVSVAGTPLGNFSVVVRITTSGAPGVGKFQTSVDGGANYGSPLTIPSTYALPQLDGVTPTGLTLTLASSFVSGDTYSFTSFASWVTTPGRDAEADPALRARDTGKWSGLGVGGGTAATFDYLARTAPSGGSEVTKTLPTCDAVVPGQVDVVVAGANGPVSVSALSAITAYILARTGICASAVVSNSTLQTVVVVAQVFVTSQALGAAQAAISAAFTSLAAATDIGGTVFWSDIVLALDQKQAGVREVFVTTPAPNTDVALAATAVPVFDLAGLVYTLI